MTPAVQLQGRVAVSYQTKLRIIHRASNTYDVSRQTPLKVMMRCAAKLHTTHRTGRVAVRH